MPLPVQQPASSVSGSGGAESQDRMRGGPAPRAAASSVADVHCAPPSGRSELFLPGTAGDFSLSASLSACTLLYEGAVEPMQIDVDPQEDPQNAPDVNYVVENPTLDLEQYAASYSGLMRIERLQFIADHCPPLRVEALKMALSFVQRTFNVDMYEEIHRKLLEAARELQNAPDAIPESGVEPPPLDTAWVEATRKKALLKLEKLDTDLKNYKGNSIKESIRRGHDDLGDHYLDCGDLSNALKCYSRARDYCTSAKHVINMCLNVIKVSVYLQNWSHVLSYVSKAESTPEIAEQRGERDTQTQAILTKLKCAAGARPLMAPQGPGSFLWMPGFILFPPAPAPGLAELAARKYKQAAKCFLLASFDHCDFPELLSPSNVAVYGGLCALATFDRQELQRNVISSRWVEGGVLGTAALLLRPQPPSGGWAGRAGSEESGICSSFKLFLELEPQVRDIIFKFYESKYASCLKMLDEMKDNLLLDMYLAPHVRTLYTQIRNRALIQYFSPYVSADMRKMATAFNTTVAALEDELTQLILEGLINARIDSHSKVGSLRAVGCGRETLGPTEPCTSTDPICPGRGSAQHHLREVPADGQGVPAPCQSHDPEGSRATQPDPCQVPSPGREPRGADASQQPVPDEHQHVRAPSASRTVCTPSALPHPPPSDSWASHLLQQHFQRCCLWPTCRGLAAG
ncbi:COP9 signalosome complex subunit 1 isoform X4 [Lagenorhynchus albirostris]|uniref:COP9 signalosome complex subunit 1 isoform X4 n=1 Tax=Lagenorhynchus albirostris TaxID=27610 RepID=UPI0028E84611|nr:COP9 signalosome complex subunit 1 isoform X4 [Lagenorhynchus albirostris]